MSNALRVSADARQIRVAAASPHVTPGDVRANAASMIECIRRADALRADYLVLPALCLTGATLSSLYAYDVLLDAAAAALRDICAAVRSTRVTVALGLPYRISGSVQSCAALLRGDRVYAILPMADCGAPFGFSTGLAAGRSAALTPVPRLQIQGDGAVFEGLNAMAGDAVLIPASANATAQSLRRTENALRLQSARTGAVLAYAAPNAGESASAFVFDGYCAVAAGGEILSSCRAADDAIACADVDTASLCTFEPFLAEPAQVSYLPEDAELAREDCLRILELQGMALARRAGHIHAKGFIVGVSGGLDSALALLAARFALKRPGMEAMRVLGVSMPGFGSSTRTKNNARLLVEALDCEYREIDITTVCREHFKSIGHDENDHSVVFENAQARERTQILLDLANKEGLLDVGTGDLSEAALGWTTFGGDHLAQFGVNASIPKTVIRRVVAAAKDIFPDAAAVLQDILDTPVSPELLPGKDGEILQKTEELIGSYELHDLFIYELVARHKGPREIYETACDRLDFPKEEIYRVLGIFLKRFFAQQFKRACAPEAPCILLSIAPACFMFPADMSARTFMEEYEALRP